MPHDLSGETGRFRADGAACHLSAVDDREAILAWLTVKAPAATASGRLSPTQLAYRKEAERFLLWMTLERRCALSSATVEDCVAYRDFLLAPPPRWCGPRAIPRWQAGWRPLEGPLSPRSCSYALSVLGNLFGFLVQQGYLTGNPWRAVTAPRYVPRGPDIGRGLSAAQWAYVRAALARLPVGLASQRLQIALPLLHDTGLRLAELLAATTADLHRDASGEDGSTRTEGWWLRVCGKGGKIREVPVPSAWVDALSVYLVAAVIPRAWGSVACRCSARAGRWLRRSGGEDGVSGSAFHRQLKRFLAACATQLAPTDTVAAARCGRPVRIGCGTRIFPMRWRPGCPWKWCSRTSDTLRSTRRADMSARNSIAD
ncbi:hypothetical protein AU476_18235 [Cupriavidus sp. UYMSc13B]|nr:hypothetical protein AU476_18235 [Cupriavidus sp. UYMSc13B]